MSDDGRFEKFSDCVLCQRECCVVKGTETPLCSECSDCKTCAEDAEAGETRRCYDCRVAEDGPYDR